MSRLTPGWTETSTRVLAGVACAVFAASAGSWAGAHWLAYAIPALALLTFAAGLAFDPFVAFVTGFGAAAAVVLMKQAAGVWSTGTFPISVLQILLLILTGGLAGMAGRHLRAHAPRGDVLTQPEDTYPEFGSLGLLRPDLGEIRLAEEIDRARGYRRPLSVLRVSTQVRAGGAFTPAREEAIRRSVARVVESLLRVTDVPFAYGDDCIVAVLPETDPEGAGRLVRRLGAALQDATFVVRPSGERLCISEFATVRFGAAHFPEGGNTAYELLQATQASLREYTDAAPGGDAAPAARAEGGERRAPAEAQAHEPGDRRGEGPEEHRLRAEFLVRG